MHEENRRSDLRRESKLHKSFQTPLQVSHTVTELVSDEMWLGRVNLERRGTLRSTARAVQFVANSSLIFSSIKSPLVFPCVPLSLALRVLWVGILDAGKVSGWLAIVCQVTNANCVASSQPVTASRRL